MNDVKRSVNLAVGTIGKRIARNIILLRESKGWNTKDLSERIGISQHSIWIMESNLKRCRTKRLFSGYSLISIAKIFGISIDELVWKELYEDSNFLRKAYGKRLDAPGRKFYERSRPLKSKRR